MTIFGQEADQSALGDPDSTDSVLGEGEGEEAQTDDSPAPEEESAQGEQEFFNLEDIPQEQRKLLGPTFRAMQKAFTQKTQSVAERSRELSRLEYQAGLLQELITDPAVAEFLRNRAGQTAGTASSTRQAEGTEEDAAETSELDPVAVKFIRREVARHLQGAVEPLRSKLGSLEEQRTLDRERSSFVAAHPDWEDYGDGMQEAFREAQRQGSDLTMEAAFRWAYFERAQARGAAQQRKAAAGKGGVEKGGTNRPSSPTRKPARSFNDAVEQALADLEMDPKSVGRR